MKLKILSCAVFLFAVVNFQTIYGQVNQSLDFYEECTIGVASGNATSDSRPLVWKTRDDSSSLNNEAIFNTS